MIVVGEYEEVEILLFICNLYKNSFSFMIDNKEVVFKIFYL